MVDQKKTAFEKQHPMAEALEICRHCFDSNSFEMPRDKSKRK